MKIELPVSLRINKPRHEIFDAIVDSDKVTRYFCGEMTGHWSPGRKVVWRFGDQKVELTVLAVEPEERLSFSWDAHFVDYRTIVTFTFEDALDGGTRVRIHETGWVTDQLAIKSALDHACGWENMLCGLKAWIEHGVDLRK